MFLDRQALVDGLMDLGTRAVAAGKIIDLSIYGGSCLILVSNFRSASQDVDAVASTRPYLSPNVETPDDHSLFGTYPSEKTPGIRVSFRLQSICSP